LFIKHDCNGIIIVLVYVDDLIIRNNEIEIELIKRNLKQKFEIKDLGKLKYFLGIEIAHSKKRLFLSQSKYVLGLLKKTGKIECKPLSTPIDSNIKINTKDSELVKDINHFQRLVGKLIYLTVTRLNLSVAVSQISKFMHSPRIPHLDAINRILRCLKGTPGKGI
jgi:Reverse transcriptase (RNA-dependent DNA polymerase)